MSKLLDEAMKKVRTLSAGEQDAVASALMDYMTSMREMKLTEEQVKEVARRKNDPERSFLSSAEVRERLLRKK